MPRKKEENEDFNTYCLAANRRTFLAYFRARCRVQKLKAAKMPSNKDGNEDFNTYCLTANRRTFLTYFRARSARMRGLSDYPVRRILSIGLNGDE